MSQPSTSPDYILIGHVTQDVLEDGSIALGGTASYASLTARALGCSVALLTSAGADCDLTRLTSAFELTIKPASVTTTFRNAYVDGTRHQFIYHVASYLDSRDLPATWRIPTIAHIAPVFNECSFDFLDAFPEKTYKGVTLQGWLRKKEPDGRVVPDMSKDGIEVFQKASAIVISEDDIQSDWRYAEILAASTPCLVVTNGYRGGRLYHQHTQIEFSAPKVVEQNPTGAGDIFAVAFFYAHAKGHDAYNAALFASCVASKSVTRVGLSSVPKQEELAHCSALLVRD